jgi:hypothetical protein
VASYETARDCAAVWGWGEVWAVEFAGAAVVLALALALCLELASELLASELLPALLEPLAPEDACSGAPLLPAALLPECWRSDLLGP